MRLRRNASARSARAAASPSSAPAPANAGGNGRSMADEAGTAMQPRMPSGTASAPPAADSGGGLMGGLKDVLFGRTGPRGGKHEGLAESAARSAMAAVPLPLRVTP